MTETTKPPPPWFQTWRQDHLQGDHRFYPRSDRQGRDWAQRFLAPMQSQVAMFFGDITGDVAALQNGVQKLAEGKPIICDECRADIWNDGHQEDCDILVHYLLICNGEGANIRVWKKREKTT